MGRFVRARLVDFREIAPEVRHFVFEVPGVERFAFTPGQFVHFRAEVGGQAVSRAYSIASPPDGNRFELCLNRVKEGTFSPWLFQMRPGDTVEMRGPYGVFTWRKPAGDSVLVATGTGIAPLRAMLEARLPTETGLQFTLVFGVRWESGLLYREEFEALAARHANFRFWPTLTQPGPGWTGRTGRVQPHLLEVAGERRDLDVYICGLKEMVLETRDLLAERGFDRKRVLYERFD